VKILYIAEVVGKAGIWALKKGLPEIKKQFSPDFTIVCADSVTGGAGLGKNHAGYLRKLGADVLTLGECCFYKKDFVEHIDKMPYVLRPANLNASAPGLGYRVFKTYNGEKIAVAVLIGQSGFARLHGNNPAAMLPGLIEKLRQETPYVVVDFHAQATAEKLTLLRIAAAQKGACSALIGSHTKVQTADAMLFKNTGGVSLAYITDAGRSGALNSVGGSLASTRIQEYLSGIPDWTREAWGSCELQGVMISVDREGRAQSIEAFRRPLPDAIEPPSKEDDKDD
jgi:metallophosphoesterase (TIGR00282 family)